LTLSMELGGNRDERPFRKPLYSEHQFLETQTALLLGF
jgi:hypothetical protein